VPARRLLDLYDAYADVLLYLAAYLLWAAATLFAALAPWLVRT
jgi:hypothetical protein